MISRPNILFLMVDCLRADVLWDRRRYPGMRNLDRLAEDASVFATTIAAATTTTPSVATMLTGVTPGEHGVRSLLGFKLRPDVRTLAEALWDGGYYTAAEVTGPLFPETGLGRGFVHYRRRDRQQYLGSAWGRGLFRALEQRRLPATTKKRILSLGKRSLLLERGEHAGVAASSGAASTEIAGHAALCVYDYLARVPLLFSGPGIFPARWVEHQVRHVDMAPTILDAVGLAPGSSAWAPSLLPMAYGDDTLDRPAVTEALQTMLHDPIRRLIGYRTGRHKLIYAPENPDAPPKLYDLQADPGELHDLAASMPGLVEELRVRAEGDTHDRRGDGTGQRMTAEEEAVVRERLEQLGYID